MITVVGSTTKDPGGRENGRAVKLEVRPNPTVLPKAPAEFSNTVLQVHKNIMTAYSARRTPQFGNACSSFFTPASVTPVLSR